MKALFYGMVAAYFLNGALAQEQLLIPYWDNGYARDVDYHSYPGILVLKHQVGKFYKVFKNPVFQPSASGWDRRDVADPHVVVTADSVFLFYDGDSDERYHIGYAVLDEQGWNWRRRGMVFDGSGGRWDAFHQIAPVVLFRDPGNWILFYSGNAQDSQLGYRMGAAMGRHNRFEPLQMNPLWRPDSTDWDVAGAAYADVLYFPADKVYRMWYTGFEGPLAAIGLAESTDAKHWSRVGKEPVFKRLPGVIAPEIIFDGAHYTMYFVQLYFENGLKTKICRTQSPDGLNWQNVEDILLPTEKWEGRKLMRPNLSFYNGQVHLFYCAQKGSRWQIGEARAKPRFVSHGVWESKAFSGTNGVLSITYQQPPETSLRLFLINSQSSGAFEADLDLSRRAVRKDVYQSTVAVPGEFTGQEIKIRLEFSTHQPEKSPMIFEISRSQ